MQSTLFVSIGHRTLYTFHERMGERVHLLARTVQVILPLTTVGDKNGRLKNERKNELAVILLR